MQMYIKFVIYKSVG